MIRKPALGVLVLATLLAAVQAQDKAAEPDVARGRVVDEMGNPVKNATVHLRTMQGDSKKIPIGVDGRFEIAVPKLSTSSTVYSPPWIVLSAKGRMSGQRMARNLIYFYGQVSPTGDIDMGDLRLPKAIPLIGTIRKGGGRPLAGAKVVAVPLAMMLSTNAFNYYSPGLSYFSDATSDAKGRVMLWCPQSGGVAVRVRADGFYLHDVPYAGPTHPLDVQLEKSGVVEGQVVDAKGQPMRSKLYVSYEAVSGYQQTPFLMLSGTTLRGLTETDAKGQFRINIDYPGRFRFRAVALSSTYVNLYQGEQSKVFRGPEKGYRLALPDAKRKAFTVKVTDAEGKPVNFRAVAVWQQAQLLNRSYIEMMFAQARASEKVGEMKLPGPVQGQPNVGKVLIKADGYAPFLSKELTWDDDKLPSLNARLVKESAIAGVVLDPAGKPVAGATVSAKLVVKKKKAVARGIFFTPYGDQGLAKTTTNAKGEFHLGTLDKGKYELRVTHDRRSDSKVTKVEVASEKTLEGVKIESPPGFSFQGSFKAKQIPAGLKLKLVRSQTSTNLFNVIVMSGGQPAGREVAVDKDGKFEFKGLPKGSYTASLVFPAMQGQEGGVLVQVKTLVITKDGEQVNGIELGRFLPTRLVGRIRFAGMALPMDRLLVVAQNQGGVVLGRSTYGQIASVKPDGSYELQLKSGKSTHVAVVDAATGIVFASVQSEVLKAGDKQKLDFDLTVGRIKVTLEPKEKGGALGASYLTVLSPEQQNNFNGMFLFQQTQSPRSGVPIAAGQREVVLFVPIQELKLLLRTGAGLLQPTPNHNHPVLASDLVQPDAKKTTKITLKVGEMPEVNEEEDPKAKVRVRQVELLPTSQKKK